MFKIVGILTQFGSFYPSEVINCETVLRKIVKKVPLLSILGMAAIGVISTAKVASAAVFNIDFDNTFDNTLSPPFVGSGIFSFDGTATDGTYNLTSLSNYEFDFTVGSSTFTNTDISTSDIGEVQVVIYDSGSQIYFSNSDSSGFGNGPLSGSIDFTGTSGDYLTFEPPAFGSPPLDLYGAEDSNGNSYEGTYGATSVPEASSDLGNLFLISLGVGYLFRRYSTNKSRIRDSN